MFSKDIGIDLGTANVLIYVKGQGIVLNEPSVIAIETESKNILAVGQEAHEMLGRTPGKVSSIRPLKDGVIADFDLTREMINSFIKKIKAKGIFTKPRILICCPSNITGVERNAIKEVAEAQGAKKVYVEEEPKVAAIGAGLDISKPTASMVIDIGGGTTDIAILSLGDIVTSKSIRVAGDLFNQDIIKYIKGKYKLLIGERTAEDIKITMPSFLEYSEINYIRSNFTILSKMKLVGYDKTNDNLVKQYKDMKKIVRRNFGKLIRWKMPLSRKILLVLVCI